MRTEKQREAARRNGAKSRGPVTSDGKTRSSRNSLRHGLYSRDGSQENNALAIDLHSCLQEVPQSHPHRAFLLMRTIREFEARVLSSEVIRQRELDPCAAQEILTRRSYRRLSKETRILELTGRLEYLLSKQAFREVEAMLEETPTEDAIRKEEFGKEEFPSNVPELYTFGGLPEEKETPRNEPGKAACAAASAINSSRNEPDEIAFPKNKMPGNEPNNAAREEIKRSGTNPARPHRFPAHTRNMLTYWFGCRFVGKPRLAVPRSKIGFRSSEVNH